MKWIAIILAACVLFLNIENLLENFQFQGEIAGLECCSGCCDAEGDQHDDKAPCDSEEDCMPDCACSYQYQITAITCNLIEVTGVVVQSYHYGLYMNSYTFEYSANFPQPPRSG
jgi:hypothetical protein